MDFIRPKAAKTDGDRPVLTGPVSKDQQGFRLHIMIENRAGPEMPVGLLRKRRAGYVCGL